MEPVDYWKLKAQLAEIEIEIMHLQMAQINVNQRKSTIIKEAGLNPDSNYRFVDETFTIEEIK
jgi:hypothetical protein